jgi:hypothetical protein
VKNKKWYQKKRFIIPTIIIGLIILNAINHIGASAVCRDGSYSYSQHRQGTCSHHGGVMKWL